MAHLSYEPAGEIISGDAFASLNIFEMALIRKALKGTHPAGGDSEAPLWREQNSDY